MRGELGRKHGVHAAVADAERHGRDVVRDIVGHLNLLLPVVIEHCVGDGRVELEYRALAARVELERPRSIFRLGRVEHVALLADRDLRLLVGGFEMIVAFLDHLPEREVRIVAVLGHVQRGHAEWKGRELKVLLPAEERLARQRIDFLDLFVSHGVAAARRAVAMHHQLGARAVPGAVKGVRIAGVEGEVVIGIRIHLPGRDRIEALGRLAVAFLHLGPEIARPAADRIGLQQREFAVAVLLPDLHLRFFLEDADQDRRILVHVLRIKFGERLLGKRGQGAAGRGDAVGVAARKRNRRGNSRRREQGAYKGSIQTRYSPKGRALIEISLSIRCGIRKANQDACDYR